MGGALYKYAEERDECPQVFPHLTYILKVAICKKQLCLQQQTFESINPLTLTARRSASLLSLNHDGTQLSS